ncbi:MAG: helix-turn-helix domain-containing protein [Lachnospiraceae bacterium]|nr:helix-turn-helix domain-containing protein [Lachnospiraceae bacterium]
MRRADGLGQLIRKQRKMLGLTQSELAERTGVSKSAIAKWETDAGLPDRNNLSRLSAALETPVSELYKVMEGSAEEPEEVNITSGVIATLEAYGYTVIRPGKDK